MIKINLAKIEAILSCFYLFVNYWYGVVTFFIPSMSLSQLVMIVDGFAILIIFFEFYKNKFQLSKKTGMVILIGILIVFLYVITGLRYLKNSSLYDSYALVLISESLLALLMACFVAKNKTSQEVMKKIIPYIGLIFSIIALYNILVVEGTMGGNWISNKNGMNYQVISYTAAFATGMLIFYLLEIKNIEWIGIYKLKIGLGLAWVLIAINGFTLLIAGGRGGFLVYAFLIIYYIFYMIKNNEITFSSLIKVIIFFIIFFLLIFYILNLAINSEIDASGINRILNIEFLMSYGDRGRLQREAFSLISKSFILGHGIGSVFFELGVWSHNLFIDIMCESGILGLFSALYVLIKNYSSAISLQKEHSTNRIWNVLFLMGFLMSMFSGYYLSNILLIWSSVFLFINRKF